VYVFLYSIMYFARLESNMTVTYLLYFGYMGIICMGIFLITGELGGLCVGTAGILSALGRCMLSALYCVCSLLSTVSAVCCLLSTLCASPSLHIPLSPLTTPTSLSYSLPRHDRVLRLPVLQLPDIRVHQGGLNSGCSRHQARCR
jgi:hypothetical protein